MRGFAKLKFFQVLRKGFRVAEIFRPTPPTPFLVFLDPFPLSEETANGAFSGARERSFLLSFRESREESRSLFFSFAALGRGSFFGLSRQGVPDCRLHVRPDGITIWFSANISESFDGLICDAQENLPDSVSLRVDCLDRVWIGEPRLYLAPNAP